jgi:hypothetical protein
MDQEPCRGDAVAGQPSPLGGHLPEVVSLTAAHVPDFAWLFLQEMPPGRDGDEVAPYLTYTLSIFGRPAHGVR